MLLDDGPVTIVDVENGLRVTQPVESPLIGENLT